MLQDILLLFQWVSDIVGYYLQHGCDMTDDKIDPALVRLTSESTNYYLTGFVQKGDPGYALIQTSTCKEGELARVRIYTETQWTPLLRASIAKEYARQLQAGSTARHYQKQIVGRIGDLYGRGRTTITDVITAIRKST
jgi:hypothetical protein